MKNIGTGRNGIEETMVQKPGQACQAVAAYRFMVCALVMVTQLRKSGDLVLQCCGGLVKSWKTHPDGKAYCW